MSYTNYEYNQLTYSSRIEFYTQKTAEILLDISANTRTIINSISNQSSSNQSSSNQKIDDIPSESIKNLGTGMVALSTAMKSVDKSAGKKLNSILTSISTFSQNVKTENLENLEAVSGAIQGISASILSFGGNMALATPLLALSYPSAMMLSGILKIITPTVTKFGTKEAIDGAKNVKQIGLGVLAFSGSLFLSSMLSKEIDYEQLIGLGISIYGFGKLYIHIGKQSKEMKGGAKGIMFISASIATFTLSMFLSSKIASKIDYGAMLGISLMIGIQGLLFSQIGKRDKQIRGGAKSVVFMAGSISLYATLSYYTGVISKNIDIGSTVKLYGLLALNALVYGVVGKYNKHIIRGALGVTVMSLSNYLFSLSIKKSVDGLPPYEDVLKLSALIGIMGGTYFLAGRLLSSIIQGAVSAIAMGGSLIVFSYGVKKAGEALSDNPDIYWQIPAIVASAGVSFAAAGSAAGLIIAGSAAMASTGAALWVIGKGVSSFPPMDEKKASGIKLSIKSVVEGFGQSFSGLSVTEALTLPLKIPMVGSMGLALIPLAKGIGVWKSKVGNWTKDDNDMLKMTIQSMSNAFATAGSTKGMTKLFGFPVGRNDTERGIASTMRMGKNLSLLSKGIISWKEMQITKADMDLVSSNIQRVLNTIPAIFASIGQRDRKGKSKFSLLGLAFGTDFSQGDVETGITSTMRLGENLKKLSDGVMAWKNMQLTPEDLKIVNHNISRVLNTIPAIFASIGRREKGDDSETTLLGMVFGTDFSKGDIETGIEATMKLGTNLKNLSEGVLAWKPNGKEGITPEVLIGIKNNIRSILDTIPEQFSRIGQMDRKTSGFFSSGDVTKGVEIIKGLGTPLKSIAELMNSVKSVNAKKKADEIGMGVKSLLNHLREAAVAEKEALETGVSTTHIIKQVERISKLAKPMEKLAKSFEKFNKAFKDHITYVSKLDEEKLESFTEWTEALEAFSEVDPTVFQKNISIAQGLNGITQSTSPPSIINNISNNAVDGVSKSSETISEELKKLGSKGKDGDLNIGNEELAKELIKLRREMSLVVGSINRLTNYMMTGTINVKTQGL